MKDAESLQSKAEHIASPENENELDTVPWYSSSDIVKCRVILRCTTQPKTRSSSTPSSLWTSFSPSTMTVRVSVLHTPSDSPVMVNWSPSSWKRTLSKTPGAGEGRSGSSWMGQPSLTETMGKVSQLLVTQSGSIQSSSPNISSSEQLVNVSIRNTDSKSMSGCFTVALRLTRQSTGRSIQERATEA